MNVEQLLSRCRKADQLAQKALFGQYSGMLFHLCRRYINDHHHAEDVMLKGFAAIFSALPRFIFEDEPRFIAWMKRIMVNECLMQLRSAGRQLLYDNEAVPEVAEEAHVMAQLSVAEIYECIATLPDGYRIVFNLYVIEEYTHKEIAQLLNITPETSRSQLLRARLQLQKMMKTELTR